MLKMILYVCISLQLGFQIAAEACQPIFTYDITLVCPIDKAHVRYSSYEHEIVYTQNEDKNLKIDYEYSVQFLSLGPFAHRQCESLTPEYPIHSCPVCHFSGKRHDFDQPASAELKSFVLKQFKSLNNRSQLDILTQADITLQIYAWQHRPAYDIGLIALAASNQIVPDEISNGWSPRPFLPTTTVTKAPYYQAMAAYYLDLAWNKKQIPEKQRSIVAFQLGEMNRRLGRFQTAINWYDLAKQTGDQLNYDGTDLISEERKRAENRDALGVL